MIAILIQGIPGTAMRRIWSLSDAERQQVAAHVRRLGQRPTEALPGDPARGRAVYERAACATCHSVNGQGATVGPVLSEIGLVRGAAYLRESLLEPGRAHPVRALAYEPHEAPAYLPVRVQPEAGPEITGLLVNEDPFTIQVREVTGRLHSFRKSNLRRLVIDKDASIMPSYRGQLDETQIADLVSYLITLRGGQ